MMKRGFFNRFEEMRRRGEEGAALASVVILSMVVLIIAASLSMTLVQAAKLTSANRSSVVTFSSAESGVDHALLGAITNSCVQTGTDPDDGFQYSIYRSASETAPKGLSDPSLQPGCPLDGDKYITIASKGTDGSGKEVDIVSTYLWIERQMGAAEGALVSGMGELNISSLDVINTESDVLIGSGNFNCNNSSTIAGDLVVLNGTVQLSNACQIKGSIYASGDVHISNNAVGVGGDIYTNGNFEQNSGPITQGSVHARGTIRFTNGARISGSIIGSSTGTVYLDNTQVGGSISTNGPISIGNGSYVKGNVLTSNTASLSMYNVKVDGDVLTNGRFEQLQFSQVGGNVRSSAVGQENRIAPDANIGGSVLLAGSLSTWGSGPNAAGGVKQNQTGVIQVAPTSFETPVQLSGKFFKWRDYSYDPSDWTTSGYQVVKKTSCDYQNNPSLVNEINNFDIPTLVDLRDCPEIKMYARTFNLKTDVSFLMKAGVNTNIQAVSINSANGAKHNFNIYVPDDVKDGNPTCNGDPDLNQIDIYQLKMGTNISGTVYSPCRIRFGGDSIINGQIYSGALTYAGGGASKLYYSQIDLPGFPMDETAVEKSGFDAEATERTMPKLVSRTEN